MQGAIGQPNARDSLAFTPPAASVDFSQPGDLTDTGLGGEGLNIRNFAQDFEFHRRIAMQDQVAYS